MGTGRARLLSRPYIYNVLTLTKFTLALHRGLMAQISAVVAQGVL